MKVMEKARSQLMKVLKSQETARSLEIHVPSSRLAHEDSLPRVLQTPNYIMTTKG